MKYFYDGGANTGQTFEWFLAKGEFQDHHIVCFEPSPRNLSALALCCRSVRGQYASVRIVTAALGRHGLHRFYEGVTPMGDSLRAEKAGPESLCIEVPVMSLSDYVATHTNSEDHVTLKLDIEGAEGDVLEELLSSPMLSRLERILVEWHGTDPRQAALTEAFAAAGHPLERWAF